jgi:hypothetical protein
MRNTRAITLTLLGVTVKSADSLCAIRVRFNNESAKNAITISRKEERVSNRRPLRGATKPPLLRNQRQERGVRRQFECERLTRRFILFSLRSEEARKQECGHETANNSPIQIAFVRF